MAPVTVDAHQSGGLCFGSCLETTVCELNSAYKGPATMGTHRASTVNDAGWSDSNHLIGRVNPEYFTMTKEVRALLYNRPQPAASHLGGTTFAQTDSVNDNEQSSPAKIFFELLQFCDGYQRLNPFPSPPKTQLEQALSSQNTERPTCINKKWPDSYVGGLSSSADSHIWYDYKTEEQIFVARFLHGTCEQILVAKYAGHAGRANNRQPFIITFAGGAWRRWDPEGFINEPQHIVRNSKDLCSQAETWSIDGSVYIPTDEDISEASDESTDDELIVEKDNGDRVLLQCHKCDSQRYNSKIGLYFHLRYRHGIFLNKSEDVVDLCGQLIESTPRATTEKKRKRRTVSPAPSPQTPERASNNHRPILTPPTTPTSCISHSDTVTFLPSTENPEINFTFKKSKDDNNPRIRPLSTCNSVEKVLVHALVAGVATKQSLIFTMAINDMDPMYVVRGDQADFKQVLDKVKEMAEPKIDIVVTVEEDLY